MARLDIVKALCLGSECQISEKDLVSDNDHYRGLFPPLYLFWEAFKSISKIILLSKIEYFLVILRYMVTF